MNLRGGRLSACKTAKPDIKARAKNTPAADGGRYKCDRSQFALHTLIK